MASKNKNYIIPNTKLCGFFNGKGGENKQIQQTMNYFTMNYFDNFQTRSSLPECNLLKLFQQNCDKTMKSAIKSFPKVFFIITCNRVLVDENIIS